jgi:hypothetical protein
MTPDDAVTVLFNFTPPNPPSPLNNSGETIVPTYVHQQLQIVKIRLPVVVICFGGCIMP